MDILKQIHQRLSEYMNIYSKIEAFLDKAPEEQLRIRKKQNLYQYYKVLGKKRIYILKKDKMIAQKLVQRDYLKKLLPVLKKNISAMKLFTERYKPNQLENCFQKLSEGRKQLVHPVFIDNQTYALQWRSKEYERKKETPEGSLLTMKNEAVRSKSEFIIANLLNTKKVPYHYEFPVNLRPGITVHPDFYCLNVRTRQEFYWEHCGMMTDHEYSENLVRRLNEYAKKGIIPGKNLILTMETSRQPLSTKYVEQIIDNFLL